MGAGRSTAISPDLPPQRKQSATAAQPSSPSVGVLKTFVGPAAVASVHNWAQTWYCLREKAVTDNDVIATVSPAIARLNDSLLCVSLSRNSIGDLAATSLSDAVSQCLLLQRIDLSDNRFGPAGMVALSIIFSTCTHLSEAVLSQNPFGDVGGLALAAALLRCRTPAIQILSISGCELSSSSIREIAAAIRLHSGMVSLDISRNTIDASGAECISESLQSHKCIRNVDLSHNRIGDSGIVAVAQCLSQFNSSVKCIGLENNDVGTEGAVRFLSLLHSRVLDFISLGQLDPCGPLQTVLRSEEWRRTGLPTPPEEVRDWCAALAFIGESLVSGKQTLRRMRFMLIGTGLAGKTRLAGALLNTKDNHYPDVPVSNRTIGINCSPLKLQHPKGDIDVEVWDFAGQEVSYLSHTQYFSARRCLYLLVWSPFLPPTLDDSASDDAPSFACVDQITRPLLLWMEMLFLRVPDAQFFLCGTHAESAKALSESKYSSLCDQVEARVNTKLQHLDALARKELEELMKKRRYLEEQLQAKQDHASKEDNSVVVAAAADESEWSRLSEDKRLDRKVRLIAESACKDALLLRSVCDRIAVMQDAASAVPCHKKLQLLKCARVDSSNGSGIAELRDLLVRHCDGMPVLGEEIPKAWIVAESLFAGMHKQLGNVVSRDRAVAYISSIMSDLQQPWEAIEFWGYLGRVFICETAIKSTRQWWIIPDMMFLLDLIRPLIHWDPPRSLITDPEFFVMSARDLYSDDRSATEALLADLKRDCVLHRKLLTYLAKWTSLELGQQNAMLEFFHKCHLVCTVDRPVTPFCLSFDSQADIYLVTARVHDNAAQRSSFIPSPSDLSTYHAHFCLPLLHISFLMRLQSELLAYKTTIDLRVQLNQDHVFVRRNSDHANKYYCCIQSLPSSEFDGIQRHFCSEPVQHEEFQHSIYVHSDDLGLFQFATQAIEQTLFTLFSGLRYKSRILTDRDKVTGFGRWSELGVPPVPTFTELWQRNWFEEFAPGKSLHSFLPQKRCPIFISHSWNDGTTEFVKQFRLKLQRESLAAVCVDDKSFHQTSSCAVHQMFRRGLCEASVVIICLTPRYLTRVNCLKEFRWALDLSNKSHNRSSVIFLPLHPACTFDGLQSLLKHKVVYVSGKDGGDLFPLSPVALELLNRYLLEHIGDMKNFTFRWSEMKAWLSDSSANEWNEEILGNAVRHLVSHPDLSGFLAVQSHADENEALCTNDINDQMVNAPSIPKRDITAAHISSFSPSFYPEHSAACFFLAFDAQIFARKREAASCWSSGWTNIQCSVKPQAFVASQGFKIDDIPFQILCSSNGFEAELKLESEGAPPSEDPNSSTQILLSAILERRANSVVPNGIKISAIEVKDSSNRDRGCWLRILKKLPLHEDLFKPPPTIMSLPQAQPTQALAPPLICDLYISACKHATVSAGRNLPLYLSAIMDSLNRVNHSFGSNRDKMSWQFGNFLATRPSLNPKSRVFFVTSEVASGMENASNRCSCQECTDFFKFAALKRRGCSVYAVCIEKLSTHQLQSLKDCVVDDVSFEGNMFSDCMPMESYLEPTRLDEQIQHLLKVIEQSSVVDTGNAKVLASVLNEIGAAEYLQAFIDDDVDDDSFKTLSRLRPERISAKYGLSLDKAAALKEKCRLYSSNTGHSFASPADEPLFIWELYDDESQKYVSVDPASSECLEAAFSANTPFTGLSLPPPLDLNFDIQAMLSSPTALGFQTEKSSRKKSRIRRVLSASVSFSSRSIPAWQELVDGKEWLQCSPATCAKLEIDANSAIDAARYRRLALESGFIDRVQLPHPMKSEPYLAPAHADDIAMLNRRVHDSLPEWDVTEMRQVVNASLASKYAAYRRRVAARCNGNPNERMMFHFASPFVMNRIWQDGDGHDPRLSNWADVGKGAYFSTHPIYGYAYIYSLYPSPPSYTVKPEPPIGETMQVFATLVCLGNVADMGPGCETCPSPAWDAWKKEPPILPKPTRPPAMTLSADAAEKRHVLDLMQVNDRPRYDSVKSTEGDLGTHPASTNKDASGKRISDIMHPRLRARAKEWGEQFVLFDAAASYPMFIATLTKNRNPP